MPHLTCCVCFDPTEGDDATYRCDHQQCTWTVCAGCAGKWKTFNGNHICPGCRTVTFYSISPVAIRADNVSTCRCMYPCDDGMYAVAFCCFFYTSLCIVFPVSVAAMLTEVGNEVQFFQNWAFMSFLTATVYAVIICCHYSREHHHSTRVSSDFLI